MLNIAKMRKINLCRAKAEYLPFLHSCFDFVLFVTSICFVSNPMLALKEAKRVLKPHGAVIIGMIDKDSFLGKMYENKRRGSKFYAYANFYSPKEIIDLIKEIGFCNISIYQTIFKEPNGRISVEHIKEGYGEGGFVVIYGVKR